MSPGTPEQLERAFVAAERRLTAARKRVAKAGAADFRESSELKRQAVCLIAEEHELQERHDQQHRHYMRAKAANLRHKAHKKMRARNRISEQKAQLRDRRRALQQRLKQLDAAAEARAREYHLHELQRAYVTARHEWLLAIREAETPQDVEQKLAYARAAMVPEKYRSPDLVWCYTVCPSAGPNVIHFFYGGIGTPDGGGHGHHVLHRNQGGELRLKFSRSPK